MLEVDRVKRRTAPSPSGHRAAEDAITSLIHYDRMADAFALINALSFVFFAQATGLDETHPQAAAEQFLRKGDSGRTRAHNANIYRQCLSVLEIPQIVDHCGQSRNDLQRSR